jgi:hypothetical protein
MAAKLHSKAQGSIDLGFGPIGCDVLSDGRRVIRMQDVRALFGRSAEKGDFERSLARIGSKVAGLASPPKLDIVTYSAPGVAKVSGVEPMALIGICKFLVRANAAGAVREAQKPMVEVALSWLTSLAGVAVDALIDEATGAQTTRPPDYLHTRLATLIREEMLGWRKVWADDLTRAMARLYGPKCQAHDGPNARWMAGVNVRLYRLILGDDAYEELKRRNPNPRHRSNHHQLLQDLALRMFERDMSIVLSTANTSISKAQFWGRMETHFRKAPLQVDMMHRGKEFVA